MTEEALVLRLPPEPPVGTVVHVCGYLPADGLCRRSPVDGGRYWIDLLDGTKYTWPTLLTRNGRAGVTVVPMPSASEEAGDGR